MKNLMIFAACATMLIGTSSAVFAKSCNSAGIRGTHHQHQNYRHAHHRHHRLWR